MSQLRKKCLCSAAIPIALGFGLAAATGPGTGFAPVAQAQSANPCSPKPCAPCGAAPAGATDCGVPRLQQAQVNRSEEHTSELQSLMRISYAVFCLKKKRIENTIDSNTTRIKYNKSLQYRTSYLDTYKHNHIITYY